MHEAQVYLASGSPRRRELLNRIGVRFERLPVDVDECLVAGESAVEHATRLALAKARAGGGVLAGRAVRPVLGADTVVVVDGDILGKPENRAQALDMLGRLSGRTHTVISAVALCGATESVVVSESRVTFRELGEVERLAYWQTGEPADKAGSYAIQGLGGIFVERLEGSFSGVMGLPVFETAQLLATAGISVLPVSAQGDGSPCPA